MNRKSQRISIKKLSQHPLNKEIYRLSDIEDLALNIDQVGLLEPLVINQKYQVLSGNRRFEAVKQLGWKTVDVVKGNHLSTDEEILHIISFNKQRIKTASEFLAEIKYLQKIYGKGRGYRTDLREKKTGKSSSVQPYGRSKKKDARTQISEEIGISTASISRLLYIEKIMPELIPLIDEGKITIYQGYQEAKRKEIYETSFQTRSKSKSIPKDDNDIFQIFHKSSESMNEVENECVDMIMCSPPYWRKITSRKKKEIGSEKTIEKYLDNLMKIFEECKRVLKSTGSLFIVIGDSYHNQSLANIPHRLAIRLCDEGWIQRNCIIWHKKNPSPENLSLEVSGL